MEAIFGILRLDQAPAEPHVLHSMGKALRVEPSKQSAISIHCEGPVGFGRIEIGREPVALPPTVAEGILCVSDSRLYRAPDTECPLDLSTSQRESLLCGLHARLGDEASNQLEGDFAYACWDKSSKRLTLVRDHIGVRPLFYYSMPGRFFLFASHSELILGSGLVPDILDMDVVSRDLLWDTSDREITLIQGLKRLEPAQVLHASLDGGLRKRRYWNLKRGEPIPDTASFSDCAVQLRLLLDDAVRRRLPRSEKVGAHLSGGLDSASIAVLAARALTDENGPLHTYSLVSEHRHDVQIEDERPFVDAIIQREPNLLNTKIFPPEHNRTYIDGSPDRVAAYGGEEENILAKADADQVDVILSGWGGDEVVSSSGRLTYAEHLARGRWHRLWREIGERAALLGTSKKSVLANEVFSHFLPVGLTNRLRHALGRKQVVLPHEHLSAFLRPSHARRVRPKASPKTSNLQVRLDVINSGSIAYRLENWAAQGMHHGIQYAFPLLDRELLEYSIRLPASFFRRHGLGRAIFREAMKGVLPESVRLNRQKLAPQPCHLLRLAEHKEEHRKLITTLREDPQLAQVFDFDSIEAALEQVPAPDDVKAEFNADAAGGESPSLDPIHVFEPVLFSKFLKERFGRD